MPSPYSLDLRERTVEAVCSGMTYKEAALIFKVGEATVKRWCYQKKKVGHIRPKENYQKGHSHKLENLQILLDLVEKEPDSTSMEYALKIGSISPRTIRKKLKLLGFSRKKSLFFTRKDQKKKELNLEKK